MATGTEASGRIGPVSSMTHEGVTGKEMSNALTSLHIENSLKKSDADEYVIFKSNGNDSLIMLFSCEDGRCGTVRIMTFLKDREVSLETLNSWNRSNRHVRAYLDKDKDTVLESDLDLDGGVTWQTVEQMLIRRQNMVPDFEKYLTDKSWKSKSKSSLSDGSIVKPTAQKTAKNSANYIKMRISNFSENLPNGCPVTLEVESDIAFDNFKPMARIYYQGPDGERSLRKKFLFYELAPGVKQPDFKVVPVDSCSQVLRVVIEEVDSCTPVGSKVDCSKIMQVEDVTTIPLDIALSSGAAKAGGLQHKSSPTTSKKSISLKVVELEERISGCKAYVEATNNTDIKFDKFDLTVKTMFEGENNNIINTLSLGHAGDPDWPNPMPAGQTVSRHFYPTGRSCADIVSLKILDNSHVCSSGSTKHNNCFSMISPAKDSIIPVTKEAK